MTTATGCPPTPPTGTMPGHVVDIIETDSWMYDIVGADKLENVSSWHHQAVTDVTSDTGLTVVAKTTVNGLDIVEAVENQSKTFCLGVQFHPETMLKSWPCMTESPRRPSATPTCA